MKFSTKGLENMHIPDNTVATEMANVDSIPTLVPFHRGLASPSNSQLDQEGMRFRDQHFFYGSFLLQKLCSTLVRVTGSSFCDLICHKNDDSFPL
jgi:hypothetical protein